MHVKALTLVVLLLQHQMVASHDLVSEQTTATHSSSQFSSAEINVESVDESIASESIEVPRLDEFSTAYFDHSSEGIISKKTRAQVLSLKPLPGNTHILPEQLLYPQRYSDSAEGSERQIDGDGNAVSADTAVRLAEGDDGGDDGGSGGIGLTSGGSFEFPPKHKRKVLSKSCNNEICKMWMWAMVRHQRIRCGSDTIATTAAKATLTSAVAGAASAIDIASVAAAIAVTAATAAVATAIAATAAVATAIAAAAAAATAVVVLIYFCLVVCA